MQYNYMVKRDKKVENIIFGDYHVLYMQMYPLDVIERDVAQVKAHAKLGYISYPHYLDRR